MANFFKRLKKWREKRQADRHNEIKDKIKAVQELRGFNNIFMDNDKRMIKKYDRKIRKLQEKLSRGRGIYVL